MAEILKKNEWKAAMDVIRLSMQAMVVAIFGLFVAKAEGKIGTDTYYIYVGTLIFCFAAMAKLYQHSGKQLDQEEAKERELMKN
jgi:putative Mn2+ efflux pump MntP